MGLPSLTPDPRSTKTALLSDLAATIKSCTDEITRYCDANNFQHASFEVDSPTTLLPMSAPMELIQSQRCLLEASMKIQQLACDVSSFLPQQQVYYQQLAAMRWLCHFSVLDHIPRDGSIAYAALAKAAGVAQSHLQRIARMAMTASFLKESDAGKIMHTRLSIHFKEDEGARSWLSYLGSASAPTALKLVEMTEKWGESNKPNETAYSLAMNIETGFFAHLDTDPQVKREFASYMQSVARGTGTGLRHLVQGYDWEALGKATIIDCGGSLGHASVELATNFRNLTCIVQDLPLVVQDGRKKLAQSPMAEHVRFQSHDFFEPQPVKGAAIYLLRAILHDWPNEKAVKILSNIGNAMDSNSKLLVMDTVLPKPGSLSLPHEAELRVRDLTMLEVFNSGEREEQDWIDLISSVDVGLQLNRIVYPPSSNLALIEISLANSG